MLGNRAEGPGIEFWGGSFLADPFGRIIAKASHDKEEILIGEIDLALIEDTRRNWPFLRDRRIDAYAPITRRFLDPVSADPRQKTARAQVAVTDRRRANWATACPPSGSRHEATWLAWPHNPEDWPGKFQPIPWLYAEIVRLLAARERVHILVDDRESRAARHGHAGARRRQSRSGQLSRLAHGSRLDARHRARSSCATPKASVAITNWRFNGWAKYPNWQLDDQFPGRVTELLGLPRWQPSIDARRRRATSPGA